MLSKINEGSKVLKNKIDHSGNNKTESINLIASDRSGGRIQLNELSFDDVRIRNGSY